MDTIGGVDRLLGNHRETVFALCLRVLRHRQDAEDACQEALLKLARHGPGEADPSRLTAWIHQVALRTAIDHHRAKVRRKAREEKAAEQILSQPEEADPMIPIAEALSELPDEERTLIVDHFFARKTLRALADERGCSEPAVWKRVEKSKHHLRKVLKAAAPAAVLALGGFLEAAEQRPPGPWTITLVAAVPVIAVVGLAVFSLRHQPESAPAPRPELRKETPSAEIPIPQQDPAPAPTASQEGPAKATPFAPPYPYELPPRHWSEPRRSAWIKFDRAKIDVSAENAFFHEILADLSQRSGVSIRLTPDTPVPTSPVTFKTKDLLLRNTIKLLLSQFDLDFDHGSDGTVWIRSSKAIALEQDLQFEEIRTVRTALDTAVRALDGGTKGIPVDPIWAALRSKQITIPSGNYTLIQVADRLREGSGLNTAVSGISPAGGDPDLERQEREMVRQVMELEKGNRPAEARALSAELREVRRRSQKAGSRPFQGGDRTLEAHLEEMAAAWNVGWAPTNGVLLILEPEPAAEAMARAKAERQKLAGFSARLDHPALEPYPTTIYQLADVLARDTGLKVVPSEKAWAAPLRASGETWKAVLEKLPAQGFRWLLLNGTIYIDR